MPKHATALRAFSIGENPGQNVAEGQVLLDMADNQFADFESIDFVREAAADEVRAAKKQPADQAPPSA